MIWYGMKLSNEFNKRKRSAKPIDTQIRDIFLNAYFPTFITFCY